MVAEAALGRPARDVVLDAIAGEDLDAAVVQLHREADRELALRDPEHARMPGVEVEVVGRGVELGERRGEGRSGRPGRRVRAWRRQLARRLHAGGRPWRPWSATADVRRREAGVISLVMHDSFGARGAGPLRPIRPDQARRPRMNKAMGDMNVREHGACQSHVHAPFMQFPGGYRLGPSVAGMAPAIRRGADRRESSAGRPASEDSDDVPAARRSPARPATR